jgi:hypothetical protein
MGIVGSAFDMHRLPSQVSTRVLHVAGSVLACSVPMYVQQRDFGTACTKVL